MHDGKSVMGILICLSLVTLILLIVVLFLSPTSPTPLCGSGVGPLVHHPDVHQEVRCRMTERARDEIIVRDMNWWRGAFGGGYPVYCACG